MSIIKIPIPNDKKVWFTSDWHLSHNNVIKYDNRPFDNIKEMNDEIIKRFNTLVKPDDHVIFLGDMFFGSYKELMTILDNINCKNIHYVYGNHDKLIKKEMLGKFLTLTDILTVVVGKQEIVCCHYAMRVWNRCHHGSWHLYGHSHGSLPDDTNSKSFDVGVMCHDYYPLEFEDVSQIMSKKTFKAVDHHG